MRCEREFCRRYRPASGAGASPKNASASDSAAQRPERLDVVPAFDEQDAARDRVAAGAQPPFRRLDGARRLVGDEQVATGHAGLGGELRQHRLRQAPADGGRRRRRRPRSETSRSGHPGRRRSWRQPRTATARRRESAGRSPWSTASGALSRARYSGPVTVVARGGFVQVEELGCAVERDVAATAQEARDAGALRHVLAAVPCIELAAAFRRDVVPDRDRALPRQAHRW